MATRTSRSGTYRCTQCDYEGPWPSGAFDTEDQCPQCRSGFLQKVKKAARKRAAANWTDATQMRENGFGNALVEYADADGWTAVIFANDEGGGEVYDYEVYNPYREFEDGDGWYHRIEDAQENALANLEDFKRSDTAEQAGY